MILVEWKDIVPYVQEKFRHLWRNGKPYPSERTIKRWYKERKLIHFKRSCPSPHGRPMVSTELIDQWVKIVRAVR